MRNNPETLRDEKLVELYHGGDAGAGELLIERYKNLVRSKARGYYLVGGDGEDIIQEGMIGLYKAVRDYDQSYKTSFKGFADLCITRQIITAITGANRRKHIPLNTYISLSKSLGDEETGGVLEEALCSTVADNPEDIVIIREQASGMEQALNKMLSPLEKQVLTLYLEGKSYTEMGEALQRSNKAVDNALQRIRSKIGKYINNR